MKKILILPFVLCFALFAHAQFGIGVAYQYGFSQTNYSGEMKNSAAGGLVKLQYHFDDYLRVNLSAGYYLVPFDKLNVDGVQTPVSGVNLSIIPVTIGGEFYFRTEGIKPYIGIDAGVAFTTQSKSDYAPAKNRTNAIIAPSFGIAYKLSENLDVYGAVKENLIMYEYADVKANYEIYQLLGVNIGINFKF